MPLLILVAGVLLLLILMISFKLNGFIALVVVAILVGIAEGMPVASVVKSVETGVGSTLGSLSLILGFGAMLGNLVAVSGAAQRITYGLLNRLGRSRVQWAVVLTGFIVGVPLFFSAGFVILIPIVFAIAASANLPLLYVGIPMAAALSVTHGFLPPHPAPTAIAVIFNADIALTLLYGIIIAIPTIVVAGPMFGSMFRNVHTQPPKGMYEPKQFREEEMPGYGISLFTALVPVILMAAGAIAGLALPEEDPVRRVFGLIGDPIIALLISVLVAIFTLGIMRGKTMEEAMLVITDAITSIAMILLIIGGGGALKQVLVDSGVGDYITGLVTGTQLSPLFLAWGIAALLRVCLGSATVAAITAAGIAAPMVGTTGVNPELMVLAVGAGSIIFSHVNDPGFWIVKEYFNLSILQTIKTWSVMETIASVMGLLGVLGLSVVV
jgi:Gnt-I system high-affinity gluconate transporter